LKDGTSKSLKKRFIEFCLEFGETKMDKLIAALGPAFAAGFAVQQLLEIIDPLVVLYVKDDANRKKLVIGLISLIVGILLALLSGVRILLPLAQWQNATVNELNALGKVADVFITGLVISAGTEGFNSILKFLGYKKEEKKVEAAKVKSTVTDNALNLVNRQ
jgi:hypothetical protein